MVSLMNNRISLTCILLSVVSFAPVFSAEVILNESNAVGSSRWLDEDGLDGSDKVDTLLGRVEGNGGNWFELAIVGDGTEGSSVDMRGWTLSWTEGDDNGEIVLSSDEFWNGVSAGTLVTFSENEVITAQDGTEVANGSDTSTDFSAGDNWAHVFAADSTYIVSTDTNVADNIDMGLAIFGAFSVGNDDWQLTIFDDTMTNVFGPIGEGADGVDAGVGSREVFKLEANIGVDVDASLYNDGSSSTFGTANVWSNDADETVHQDFSAFGVVPEPNGATSLSIVALLSCGLRRRRNAS